MSPYSTPSLSSASSSETAVAESQAQLLERSGSALKAPKSSKMDKTPQEWSPELRQAIARDIDEFFGGPEPVKVKKPKPAVPKAPRADRGQNRLLRLLSNFRPKKSKRAQGEHPLKHTSEPSTSSFGTLSSYGPGAV
ncbi:hypothetical protein RSAG8_08952, partial [Rhizoctonia solani AG-8 WAC10335]